MATEIPPLRVLLAQNPSPMTLEGTRTFLVGKREPVVIDPGPADPEHIHAISAALAGRRPLAILLTHAHPDHAAGAPALARETGAPIRMAAGALSGRGPAERVDRWMVDGESISTDAGLLTAIATPGHAPEHLSFHWTGPAAPAGGAVFVGDLLMGSGDTTLVAPPEGDLRLYLGSLDRVDRLGAGVLYPSHGPPLHDPGEAVARYRRHRLERIAQVARALEDQPGAGADDLVTLIYGSSLEPSLRGAAAGSVTAILRYLDEAATD